MLQMLHWLVVAGYVAAPVVAVIVALVEAHRERARAAARLFVSVLIGSAIGISASVGYAYFAKGRVSGWQFFLAIYFSTSMMLVLNLLDSTVRTLTFRMARKLARRRSPASEAPPTRTISRQILVAVTQMLLGLGRGAVLIGVGLPYVVAVAVTYRPKVHVAADPRSVLGCGFASISFPATDGTRLAGWWIPAVEGADRAAPTSRPADFGSKTIILCHGFGGSKATQLSLVRRLIPAGYNVLAFDFRAHGESDGQLTSLGDLERRDVLGAVEWIQKNQPERSKKIYGVGASMGAAALIAAAADPGAQGQAIEAVAVYGVYDDLSTLAGEISTQMMLPPMDWFTLKLGLPIASLQAGTNLAKFKPAQLADELWPRPILVIHGTHDLLVPFDRGTQFFDSAVQPKQRVWLQGDNGREAVENDRAARTVRQFFDTAAPVPVI